MNIVGTGLSGLVGKRVVGILSPEFSFENLSLETGVDITNQDLVNQRIIQSKAPWVFHFAAATDVDACEKEKGLKEQSTAWRVNVLATEYIVSACRRTGKHLLYISTDFVFDGTKSSYTEEDLPHPLGWYAITKYEGEKRVKTLGDNGLIVRIANPYKAINDTKLDFVHKVIGRLRDREQILSTNDQIFVPTFIDDIALAIKKLLELNAKGIYHVVGSQALTPYVAAQKIAVAYGYDTSLIKATTFAEYFQEKAPRPFRANIKNDRIAKLGIKMLTFDEGLKVTKEQQL